MYVLTESFRGDDHRHGQSESQADAGRLHDATEEVVVEVTYSGRFQVGIEELPYLLKYSSEARMEFPVAYISK